MHTSARLRALLHRENIDALFVTNLSNVRYVTHCNLKEGCVLIEPSRMRFFVDLLYRDVAAAQFGIRVFSMEELSNAMKRQARIGIEREEVTLACLSRLKAFHKNTKFVQTSHLIEGLRREKTTDELQKIRRASTITKRLLKTIPSLLKTGVTERSLALTIRDQAERMGADEMAFDTIVAFGEHTARPHHVPTDRKLRRGDIVQIDCGLKWKGYCSDFSRVYVHGQFSEEQKKVYQTLQKAKRAAEKLLRAGITNHALDEAARVVLRAGGYESYFPHALGHGVGLDIHEGIRLTSKGPREILKKHEVVTLEPGIYFPRKWGMRLEDTYIVS